MGKALDVDWSPIQLDYQKGLGSLKDLSIKYNVGLSALEGRCRREGWRQQMTELSGRVSAKVVETLVDERVKAIKDHEAKAYRVSDKLISGVENNYDAMPDGLLDVSMLNGLAQALSTSVKVARLSLGAVDPSQKLDVTSGGLNLHESMLKMIEASRAMAASGKLLQSDVDALDVESMVKELAESKKLEGQ